MEVIYDLIAARHAVTLLVHAWRVRHDPGGARLLERPRGMRRARSSAMAGAGRETLDPQLARAAAGTSGRRKASVRRWMQRSTWRGAIG